jgi:hypothetical protein
MCQTTDKEGMKCLNRVPLLKKSNIFKTSQKIPRIDDNYLDEESRAIEPSVVFCAFQGPLSKVHISFPLLLFLWM